MTHHEAFVALHSRRTLRWSRVEHRLQHTNKAHLILLLQELAARHPQLLSEVSELLARWCSTLPHLSAMETMRMI